MTTDNSSATSQPTILLTEVTEGKILCVRKIQADNEDSTRLKRLGICVGRQIQLVQTGDPMILRVVGARVGISRKLAEKISVEAVMHVSPATET